jgi:transposase
MKLLSHLLPTATGFRLDSCHLDEAQGEITLTLTSRQTAPHCPLCHLPARRLHSRYRRTLADLPWGSYRVKLWLRVRRLFVTIRGRPQEACFTRGRERRMLGSG